MVRKLDKLQGCFWTDKDEMVQDFIEATGYEVVFATTVFVVLEGEDEQIYVELIKAGKTMAIFKVMYLEGDDYDDEL